jgi:nicotinamidase/pyrazinamidase
MEHSHAPFHLAAGDALIVVDVQNDFVPGGSLEVPHGDAVIAPLNQYMARFAAAGLPVFATRDWHPADHCSFRAQGGPWPPHCVAGTPGAAFASALQWPSAVRIISKGAAREPDAYSAFARTELAAELRAAGVRRVFVGGLATDYCVVNTALDALGEGFATILLEDAIRAVDVQPGDGAAAIARMMDAGAHSTCLEEVQS